METYKKKILLICTLVMLSLSVNAMTFTVDGVKYDTNGSTATVVGFDINDGEATISIPDTVYYYGVPFSVTSIYYTGGGYFKKLIIPKTINNVVFKSGLRIKEIEVSAENNKFTTLDNVLVTKNKMRMLFYPGGDEREEFVVPQEIKVIASYAINAPKNLKKISILHKCSLEANSFINFYSYIETIELDYTEEDLNDIFKPVYNISAFQVSDEWEYNKWKTLRLGKNFCNPDFLKVRTYYADIEVDAANNYMCKENGLLLTKDKKKLLKVPGYHNMMDEWDIIIPEGVEDMDEYAFLIGLSTSYSSLTFPSTIKHLSRINYYTADTGEGVSSIGLVEFKEGNDLTVIPDKFLYRVSISELKLSNSIKHIGESAFVGWPSTSQLREIKLPDNLETIARNAFYNNELTNIVLPTHLNYIGSGAFYNLHIDGFDQLPALSSIVFLSSTPPNCEKNEAGKYLSPVHPTNYKSVTLIVPRNSKSNYENAPVWKEFVNIVEGDFDAIDHITVDPLDDSVVDVYTMQGQLLRHRVPREAATQGLAPGIYIVGNKKVVVR